MKSRLFAAAIAALLTVSSANASSYVKFDDLLEVKGKERSDLMVEGLEQTAACIAFYRTARTNPNSKNHDDHRDMEATSLEAVVTSYVEFNMLPNLAEANFTIEAYINQNVPHVLEYISKDSKTYEDAHLECHEQYSGFARPLLEALHRMKKEAE